ncbi:helix-turn-helix domain-containing protein [Candidatus Roizmanbacteria bacterium]|nr:helix-turn-helix domain-containing protein [Candidatus Roizmanbacteria bacterium]
MTHKIKFTSQEENKRQIINLAITGKITTGEAAKQLGITDRQVRRLKQRLKVDGVTAVVHGLKGRASNHLTMILLSNLKTTGNVSNFECRRTYYYGSYLLYI